MSPFRFRMTPALLGGISALVPGEKSALSPLRLSNSIELTPDQRTQLEASGLLNHGQLKEEAGQLLETLGHAAAFSRLRLNAPYGMLDEAVYFGEDPLQTVQISSTPEALDLAAPSDIDSLLARVSEFTGNTGRLGSAWAEELPPLEGLVLAALMDLRRKAVLRALLDNKPVMPPPSDVQSIAAAIQGLMGNAQWFTATVQNVCGLNSAPPPVQVQSALDSLEGKRRIWKQNDQYFPLPEAIQAADRFLITQVLLSLDLGHANSQGKAAFNRMAWLQSGASEMFHVSQTINQVRMETVTPTAMLEKVRYCLSHIEALPAPPEEVVQLALTIQSGVGAGQTFPLAEETVLGRSEQAHVRILDARASRRHSVIQKIDQGYQVSDAGSTNGTYLNGRLLTAPAWLKEGDVIAIGDTKIAVIRAGATPPPASVESQRTIYANEDSHPVAPAEPTPQPAIESPIPPAAAEAPAEPLIPQPAEAPAEPVAPVPAEPPAVPVEDLVLPAPEPPVPPVLEVSGADLPEPLAEPEPFPPAPADPAVPEPDLTHCPRCGNEVAPAARFCGTCGMRLKE